MPVGLTLQAEIILPGGLYRIFESRVPAKVAEIFPAGGIHCAARICRPRKALASAGLRAFTPRMESLADCSVHQVDQERRKQNCEQGPRPIETDDEKKQQHNDYEAHRDLYLGAVRA